MLLTNMWQLRFRAYRTTTTNLTVFPAPSATPVWTFFEEID